MHIFADGSVGETPPTTVISSSTAAGDDTECIPLEDLVTRQLGGGVVGWFGPRGGRGRNWKGLKVLLLQLKGVVKQNMSNKKSEIPSRLGPVRIRNYYI